MLIVKKLTLSSLLVLSVSAMSTSVFAVTSQFSFNDQSNTCQIRGSQTLLGSFVRSTGDSTNASGGTIRSFEAAVDTITSCRADSIQQTIYVTNKYAGKSLYIIRQVTSPKVTNSRYLGSSLVYSELKTRNDPNTTVNSNLPHCLWVSRSIVINGLAVSSGLSNLNWQGTPYRTGGC